MNINEPNNAAAAKKQWETPHIEVISKDAIKSGTITTGPETFFQPTFAPVS